MSLTGQKQKLIIQSASHYLQRKSALINWRTPPSLCPGLKAS